MLTTYDENGGYPHPDHIRCHEVSVAAYEAAGDYRLFPDAGEPWSVPSCTTTTGSCVSACSCSRTSSPSTARMGPFEKWLKDWDPELDVIADAGHHPDRVREVLRAARRRPARACHPDRPESFFFTTPMEWQQRLWPTEEFELARSRVPVNLPETDLFAGIDP